MHAKICKMVYRTKNEQLWMWSNHNKDWQKPAIIALSGGGRGQYAGPYGLNGERANTGRISNMGGAVGSFDTDPTKFGTIPNGIYEVGPPRPHKTLGRCAFLKPVFAAMMGRNHFFIHGRGNKGSEGCIIPIDPKVEFVLHRISVLRSVEPLYLRVESSVTFDLPDQLPSSTV